MYQMMQFQEERLWAAAGWRKNHEIIQETITYLRERQAFGKPLLDNQFIQYKLAELKTEIEALRALTYRACEMYIAGEDVTDLAGARAQRDAFDAVVNGASRANLDATFAGIDYQGVYFDVPNGDPSGIDDLIDVAAKIETWVREFYAEAFQ